MKRLVLICILLSCLVIFAKAQNAKQILTQYLDTVSGGDIKNLYRVKSIVIESHGFYIDPSGASLLTLNADKSYGIFYKVWPDKEKSELYADSARTRLTSTFLRLDGKMTMLLPNFEPMEGSPRVSYELPGVRIHKLLTAHKKLSLKGVREIQGQSFYHVEAQANEHGQRFFYHLYFDTNTYLLVYQNKSLDGDQSVMTKLERYEKFGSIMIPCEEVLSRNDNIYHTSLITRVSINESIEPDIFKLPHKN